VDATPHPWDRHRDATGTPEPARWFARFTAYRTTSPAARSILGTVNAERVTRGHKGTRNTPRSWREASERWHWKQRVEAWDAVEHERAEQEAAAKRIREAAELEAARLEAIANQREDARLMREKGRAILSTLPLVKQVSTKVHTDDDGRKTTEVLEVAPASSAEYRAAQALLDSAAKLEAARLGLPTEVQQVDLKSAGGKLVFTVVREGAGNE